MLTAANRQESDERNLHTRQRPQRIPRRIAHIQPRAIPSHADQHESVQRQQIRNEDVSTPGRHHVTVEQSRARAPKHGAILDGLDPQEEGEDEQKDGNGLVIVAPGHGARDVAGRDAHEGGRKETGRGRSDHFIGQEVGCERSEA